jgi:hypothetical protein
MTLLERHVVRYRFGMMFELSNHVVPVPLRLQGYHAIVQHPINIAFSRLT